MTAKNTEQGKSLTEIKPKTEISLVISINECKSLMKRIKNFAESNYWEQTAQHKRNIKSGASCAVLKMPLDKCSDEDYMIHLHQSVIAGEQ